MKRIILEHTAPTVAISFLFLLEKSEHSGTEVNTNDDTLLASCGKPHHCNVLPGTWASPQTLAEHPSLICWVKSSFGTSEPD